MINVYLLVGSVIGWFALLTIIKWKWSLSTASASYAVAFVHGIFTTRATEYIIYTDSIWSAEQFGGPVTPLQAVIITISAGYFLYDIWVCFKTDEALVIKCHHVLATTIFATTLWAGKSGPEVVVCLWCGEFTNVFLNLRFFFQNYKGGERFRNSVIPFLNDVLFVIGFAVMRFGIGSYAMYHIFFSGRSLQSLQLCCVGFTTVNLYLGKMIVDEVSKTLSSMFSSKKSSPPPSSKVNPHPITTAHQHQE